jgi:hypothetical protein
MCTTGDRNSGATLSIKVEEMIVFVGILGRYNFQLDGRRMTGRFGNKETTIEFSNEGDGIVVTGTGEGASACLAHLKRCHAAGHDLPIAASAVA